MEPETWSGLEQNPFGPSIDSVAVRGKHFVKFYEDDACLVDALTHYVGGAVAEGSPGIFVASAKHLASVAEQLGRRGFNVGALRDKGQYLALDAAEMLSHFMVDGWPDRGRFDDLFEGLLEHAVSGRKSSHAWVFGEMVSLLWNDRKFESAIQLEKLWNDLHKRHSFSLFCAYPLSGFDGGVQSKRLHEVCAEHDHVIPAESYAALATPEERLELVLQLQQKARALDGEIVRRKELEESVRRLEKELGDLLETMHDGVLDVSTDGRILAANQACLSLLGHGREDCMGRPMAEILEPGVFDAIWSKLARGQTIPDTEITLVKGGLKKPVRLRSALLRMVDKSFQMRWFLYVAEANSQ
jgi:PAS domain S-box-containing protein